MSTLSPRQTQSITRESQVGFSLVELMVAITVGLFLTAGLLQIYLGSKQSYRVTDAISRLQENGRFALEYLARDIRQAGFKSLCVNEIDKSNLLDETSSSYTADRFDLRRAVMGWNGTKGDDPDVGNGQMASYEAGTDVIMFKHAAELSGLTVSGTTSDTSETISLAGPNGLNNAILVIADDANDCYVCCDVFQNRAADTASNLSRAASGTPGNKDPAATNLSHSYGTDMEIRLLRSRMYFIATGANGLPALWERRFDEGAPSPPDEQELVGGVFDMQITYLVSGGNYVDASAVSNWNDVLAVKLNLLLGSNENNLVEQPMSLPFILNDGTAFTATDRRIYQTFNTTVGLRNRLP
ncbi:PilW family protein [Thiorhodococcus mannitoliphagus]|nr:PilW family protein [Thiorhodococcus mannitoliphagus]